MRELEKMKRVAERIVPGAPHETFLVLDATTGQNALAQAKTFSQILPLTGLILAKLDGTAKGGIAIAIYDEVKVPVKFIGIGEKVDDIAEFSPREYVNALFSEEAANAQ
jgi:fused signal recognition particle receptor